MRGHPCRLCGRPDVPVFRFVCPQCFAALPLNLRREGVRAYKFRMADPGAYAEALAAILSWRRDRMATPVDSARERSE